ncbi:MAG: siphovirus Gp157 family protein [Kofleriaceae bacterium]
MTGTTITPKVTLREMFGQRTIIDEWLLETEGEETPAIAELWDKLEGDIAEKVERWALWIQARSAEAAAIREEEQRLAARRRAIENAVERSKTELQRQLELAQRDKVQGLLCTVALQNNPKSLRGDLDDHAIRNLAMMPEFASIVRHVPERYELDRRAVLELAKAGQPIPVGLEVMQTRSLRIR